MNYEQIEEARAIAPIVTHNFSATDTAPWIVIQYVPDLGTGASSATIALVEASSMTFVVDSTVPAGADAIGTSTGGVILTSAAAYNTMGELVDYINGRQAWRAYLVGALRADKSSLLLAKSAARCDGDNGLTFYADCSDAKSFEMAISGEKFVNNGINGHVKDWDDGCENSLLLSTIQLTFTGVTNTIKVYSGKQGSTETQLHSETLTSTTAVVWGEEAPNEPWITAKRGERLIIRCAVGTAISAWTNWNVNSKTAVLSGSRIVNSVNY